MAVSSRCGAEEEDLVRHIFWHVGPPPLKMLLVEIGGQTNGKCGHLFSIFDGKDRSPFSSRHEFMSV